MDPPMDSPFPSPEGEGPTARGAECMKKYEIIKDLGAGAYGRCQLVRRKTSGKLYVIKKVDIYSLSEAESSRAVQEVEFLQKMDHPNVIHHKESFVHEKFLNIVMEYANAGDLATFISKRASRKEFLDEQTILSLFVQILLGVKHIHGVKLLHRDIKPENIFLNEPCPGAPPVVKIGDFGVAKVLNNTKDFTSTLIGSPYYLSPEVVDDKPYSFKSDIWSLGCVLYELVTLKKAFPGSHIAEVMTNILRGEYAPIPKHFPVELGALIKDMLTTNPEGRPSARDLVLRPYLVPAITGYVEQQLEAQKTESEQRRERRRKQKWEASEQPIPVGALAPDTPSSHGDSSEDLSKKHRHKRKSRTADPPEAPAVPERAPADVGGDSPPRARGAPPIVVGAAPGVPPRRTHGSPGPSVSSESPVDSPAHAAFQLPHAPPPRGAHADDGSEKSPRERDSSPREAC